jgi:hypothetical protein
VGRSGFIGAFFDEITYAGYPEPVEAVLDTVRGGQDRDDGRGGEAPDSIARRIGYPICFLDVGVVCEHAPTCPEPPGAHAAANPARPRRVNRSGR